MKIKLPQLAALAALTFALTAAPTVRAPGKVRILVICTGNSARSQIAAGFLKTFDPRLDVYSGGTAPAPRINPYAVRAMQEVGVDISDGTPKNVRRFLGDSFDFVITVCDEADKECPNFRGKVGKRRHIPFPDPARATGTDDEIMTVFRNVRNDIRTKFTRLFQDTIKKKF
jgi:arsenate reductase